jgi:hypothetical protein
MINQPRRKRGSKKYWLISIFMYIRYKHCSRVTSTYQVFILNNLKIFDYCIIISCLTQYPWIRPRQHGRQQLLQVRPDNICDQAPSVKHRGTKHSNWQLSFLMRILLFSSENQKMDMSGKLNSLTMLSENVCRTSCNCVLYVVSLPGRSSYRHTFPIGLFQVHQRVLLTAPLLLDR